MPRNRITRFTVTVAGTPFEPRHFLNYRGRDCDPQALSNYPTKPVGEKWWKEHVGALLDHAVLRAMGLQRGNLFPFLSKGSEVSSSWDRGIGVFEYQACWVTSEAKLESEITRVKKRVRGCLKRAGRLGVIRVLRIRILLATE